MFKEGQKEFWKAVIRNFNKYDIQNVQIKHFPMLLEERNVPTKDKKRIGEVLKKPRNALSP